MRSTTRALAAHAFFVALSVSIPAALLCAAMLVASSRSAQAGVNAWTNLGPPGGEVHALVIDPTRPGTLYVGTTGGVFKSGDGGITWSATGAGGEVFALAIDPTDPAVLYAGTYGGVFKSTDGGSTWAAVYEPGIFEPAVALAVDATGKVYAGTGFCTCGGGEGGGEGGGVGCGCFGGVVTSTDGGGNWQNMGLTNTVVATLAIDATRPGTLYAGTFNIVYGSPGIQAVVFKSTDGGLTWNAANTGLPETALQCIGGWISCGVALAIDPATPSTVYAGTGQNGVFKSTDGGATWTAASTGLPDGAGVGAFAIDPITPRTLYAATYYNGVFKSTDGGATWTSMGLSGALYVLTIAIDPALPGALYAAGAGVFRSTDSAATWAATGFGNGGRLVSALVVDPITPGTLYVSTGGYGTISKSTDGGGTWAAAGTGLRDSGYVVALAIDPTTPSTLYAATLRYDGQFRANAGVFKTTDAGATWAVASTGLGRAPISALVIDPVTPTTLYVGTEYCEFGCTDRSGVVKTTDGGNTWNAASTGLPDSGYVVALAIDPTTPNTLYAATGWNGGNNFGVFKSTDAGTTWTSASTGLPDTANVVALAVDPSRTLYAATYYAHGIFKTTDGAATWTPANAGLPNFAGYFPGFRTLAIDPTAPRTLYAGTRIGGGGVFKSTNGGGTWRALNRGLTDIYDIYDIESLALAPAAPARLYAGTLGGLFAIEQVCVCDCSGDGAVTIDELVTAVNIALDRTPLSTCQSLDADSNGSVMINELITAVNEALNGCL